MMSSPISRLARGACAAALAGVALPALAHAGDATLGGFMQALAHPWSGADHLLAALTAGMLAAHLGRRAGTALCAAYLFGLISGALLATGAAPQFAESLLGASVAALALLMLRPAHGAGRFSAVGAAALFALLHGLVHQLERGRTRCCPPRRSASCCRPRCCLASARCFSADSPPWTCSGKLPAWPIALAGAVLFVRASLA